MHLPQPLYRRGPDWGHRIHSAQWPGGHFYGPPVALDALSSLGHVRQFDSRMFALYFLITETLATYVGYRIAQHCLRGRGLFMLPRALRVGIVFTYCALKIGLIDYAFHGSLYEIVSMIIAFCFSLCTLVAIVFHFGPLQFVFADFRGKRKGDASVAFSISDLLRELKCFMMKQHFHEYAIELTTKRRELMASVATTVASAPGIVRVPWLFVGEIELNITQWNEWFTRHAAGSISKAARSQAKRALVSASPSTLEGYSETRFVMLMLPGGLLIDVLLKPPTASLMYRIRSQDVFPLELVVRVMSASSDRRLFFCYAECAKLVGSATPVQKAAIFALLSQLNAVSGLHIDVPLRSLRCKSSLEASCVPSESFRRTKPRRDKLSSRLESAFG